MIDRRFWETVAEVWTKKTDMELLETDIGMGLLPDDPQKEYIDFDEINEIDEFLKDMLKGG